MNPTMAVLRAGRRRGLIELRQSFTNGPELFSHFLWPVMLLVAVFFMGDTGFAHSGFLLGDIAVPGIIGMNVAIGMVSMSQHLTADREDGTLLRAKATPNGMQAYLVGKVISVSGGLLADLAIFAVPGAILVGGFSFGGPAAWLTLIWLLALGMTASLPLGAVLGSVFASPRAQGIILLPILGLIAISGIFYPITALPEWLQWVAQGFPFYWLGLGMRSALLPGSAVGIEIGESWRHLETVGVLGLWAVTGMALAPVVLRRMARRESGSRVAKRREQALRRVGA